MKTASFGHPRHTDVIKQNKKTQQLSNDMSRKDSKHSLMRFTGSFHQDIRVPALVSYLWQRSASFVALNEYRPFQEFVLLYVEYRQPHKPFGKPSDFPHSSHEPLSTLCTFFPTKQLILLTSFPVLLDMHVFISEISCCVFEGNKKPQNTPETSAAGSYWSYILSLVTWRTESEGG